MNIYWQIREKGSIHLTMESCCFLREDNYRFLNTNMRVRDVGKSRINVEYNCLLHPMKFILPIWTCNGGQRQLIL